jgi:hypothetical protein
VELAERRKRNAIAAKKWRKSNPKYLRKWQIATDHPRKHRARNPEKYLFMWAKGRAKKRGLVFTITEADVVIPERCPVLGMVLKSHPGRMGAGDSSPTLDRFKPELGYIPGNVCVISWRANSIKKNATLEELEKIARWVRTREENDHNISI